MDDKTVPTDSDIREALDAITSRDISVVRSFLEAYPQCVDVVVKSPAKFRNKSPLIVALQSFAFEIAGFLLDRDADPNFRCHFGRSEHEWITPLYVAVDMASLDAGELADEYRTVLESMLREGGDPNVASPEGSVFNLAVIRYRPQNANHWILKMLIEHGADRDVVIPIYGQTSSELVSSRAGTPWVTEELLELFRA